MSLHLGIRRNSRPKHRAVDAVEDLREEARRLREQLVGAASAIGHLDQRLAEVTGQLIATRGTNANLIRQANDLAIERNQLARDNETLAAQLAPYLAADANRNAITVPPSVRDTTAGEDQATTPIDVRPLWQAIGISPIVRVDNPQATDPTHIPVPAP
jgi:septal ring factor EnvC (AmiA/AmiB activator)